MKITDIIYIPSIKKDFKTGKAGDNVLPGIDIILIDYILVYYSELELIYMPFKEEEYDFVKIIKEQFEKYNRFHFHYFSLDKFLELSDLRGSVLITDISKIGFYFSLKTFKPSFLYIPFLFDNSSLENLFKLSEFFIKFSDLSELSSLLSKEWDISDKIKQIMQKAMI